MATNATARDRSRRAIETHATLQHVALLGSALVLTVTGLTQRFGFFGASEWIMDSAGGIENLRTAHHIAGAVLIFAVLYHAAIVVATVLSQGVLAPLKMVPTPRDYRVATRRIMCLLGLSTERVSLDHPTYLQKLDYWVLVWGFTVMAGSGILRLFPVRATDVLPGDVAATALRAHGDFAVLMVAWIFIVHLAYTGLTPPLFESRKAPAAAAAPVLIPEAAPDPESDDTPEPVGQAPVSGKNPRP